MGGGNQSHTSGGPGEGRRIFLAQPTERPAYNTGPQDPESRFAMLFVATGPTMWAQTTGDNGLFYSPASPKQQVAAYGD